MYKERFNEFPDKSCFVLITAYMCEDWAGHSFNQKSAGVWASVTQRALRACVFVLKQLLAFGWRVCRTFRKLHRAALPFQREIVASENENTFIARCYWRNNSRSDFVVNAYWAIIATDRLIDRSIDLDGRKTRAATSTRYKNKTNTSSKDIDVFIARCHWSKLL